MPLTDCRAGLAQLLSENRTFESYLAGGAATKVEWARDSAPHFGRPGGMLPRIADLHEALTVAHQVQGCGQRLTEDLLEPRVRSVAARNPDYWTLRAGVQGTKKGDGVWRK